MLFIWTKCIFMLIKLYTFYGLIFKYVQFPFMISWLLWSWCYCNDCLYCNNFTDFYLFHCCNLVNTLIIAFHCMHLLYSSVVFICFIYWTHSYQLTALIHVSQFHCVYCIASLCFLMFISNSFSCKTLKDTDHFQA